MSSAVTVQRSSKFLLSIVFLALIIVTGVITQIITTNHVFAYAPIVSDSNNYKLVGKWGGVGTGHRQLNHPASIDNDPDGLRFYIADLDNNRIQVLQGDGDYVDQWGTIGKGNGQFNNPGSIAVDDIHKAVFVADIKNNRIEKFDTQGNFITQWGSLGKAEVNLTILVILH